MSQIIKPVMLDETGQVTNQRLNELGGKVDSHKDTTSAKLTELGGKVDILGTKMQNIADAIESVHSVNGMTGDVVIDSSNIVLNKLTNPKTIAQVLSEEQSSVNTAMSTIQEAITRTPVNMSTSQIEDTDDYVLELTLSTP